MAKKKFKRRVQPDYRERVFEIRECATLGTNFADVYIDGELFARELSRPVAETFVQFPDHYPNWQADMPKIMTWLLEHWDSRVVEHLERDGLLKSKKTRVVEHMKRNNREG